MSNKASQSQKYRWNNVYLDCKSSTNQNSWTVVKEDLQYYRHHFSINRPIDGKEPSAYSHQTMNYHHHGWSQALKTGSSESPQHRSCTCKAPSLSGPVKRLTMPETCATEQMWLNGKAPIHPQCSLSNSPDFNTLWCTNTTNEQLCLKGYGNVKGLIIFERNSKSFQNETNRVVKKKTPQISQIMEDVGKQNSIHSCAQKRAATQLFTKHSCWY